MTNLDHLCGNCGFPCGSRCETCGDLAVPRVPPPEELEQARFEHLFPTDEEISDDDYH